MGPASSFSYNEDEGMVIVIFPGVILRFDGVSEMGENWTGTLTSIRLMSSSAYSIGYNLFVGMTRTQILLAYPFIDESNYVFTINTGSRDYDVTFGFGDGDVVEYVKVSA